MITVTIRDTNCKRITLEGVSESSILEKINRFGLTENDEILLVTQNGMCLYSALGTNYVLTADELRRFFV